MLAFPNSFGIYKMFILAPLCSLITFALLKNDIKLNNLNAVCFYVVFSLISAVWILWGMVNAGHEQAFFDSFKLYVAYSPIFCLLVVALQNGRFIDLIFRSIIISAWIIVFINLMSLSEVIFGFHFYPDWFKDELTIGVGLHEGYTDVSADNINSLFFIIPVIYIMAVAKQKSINYSKISIYCILVLCMFVALASGRRALIILMLIVPVIYEIQKKLFLSKCDNKTTALNYFPILILWGFPFFLLGALYLSGLIEMDSLFENFTSLVDTDNERAVQLGSLLNGFYDKYLLGSGFGGSVDVIRSYDRPWMYELSYFQLLFNGGLIGSGLLFSLFAVYYIKALMAVRRFDGFKTEALALLVGVVIFCIAAGSNPYFSCFDFLFLLGIFPLLSGWKAYFCRQIP